MSSSPWMVSVEHHWSGMNIYQTSDGSNSVSLSERELMKSCNLRHNSARIWLSIQATRFKLIESRTLQRKADRSVRKHTKIYVWNCVKYKCVKNYEWNDINFSQPSSYSVSISLQPLKCGNSENLYLSATLLEKALQLIAIIRPSSSFYDLDF